MRLPLKTSANRTNVLALYDEQMRADPAAVVGIRHERVGEVVRGVGLWNIVLFWDRSGDATEAVFEQAAFARAARVELEWKVYDHDGPPGLEAVLERAGFVQDEGETLMVLDLETPLLADARACDYEIRRVVDAAGVDDYVAASSAAFGEDKGSRAAMYQESLGDPALSLFVAYRGGEPAAAGRLQMPRERAFASIWGGGTTPEHRGLGIYRALVAHRANVACERGYRYLTVDARETSRPILERLGFVALSGVRGWVLRP
jgi:ribosomal protein S18 acetylase RimI-like enzyme